MESEQHVDQHSRSRSRSSSRSFICPDCGLGVESIAALTVHLLTHAELGAEKSESARRPSCQAQKSPIQSQLLADTRGDDELIDDRPTTAGSRDDPVDDVDDDDAMDVDDCRASVVNHDQSDRHHHHQQRLTYRSENLDAAAQPDCESDDDDEPKCLKVECRRSTSEDALDGVVLLECPYCQRKDFDSVGPLTSHIRTAHARPSDNLFTCGSCGLAFATVSKLEHHQRAEHDAPTSSTPAISAASSSLSGGQASPAAAAVDGLTEPRWLCRFCPMQFYDAETQKDHEESIHLSRASVTGNIMAAASVVFCSQCSLGFPHIYALADHMHHSHGYNARARAAVQDVPAGAAADALPAPACRSRDPVKPTAVRADSVDLARGHAVNATTSVSAPTCPECSATFDNDDELESHVASTHYLSLGTEYGCTNCLKLFARPEDLQKHLMDVHAHHLYRCTLCKQVFDSKVVLLLTSVTSCLFKFYWRNFFFLSQWATLRFLIKRV